MDIKEYIASGILESYALGTVSEQERREVECMSAIYPEIREALVNYQLQIEKVASANAITPPSELKDRVLSAVYEEIDKDTEKGKVVQGDFGTKEYLRQKRNWKIMAAASFTLFILVTGSLIFSYTNYSSLESKVASIREQHKQEKNELLEEKATLEKSIVEKQEWLAFLADVNTKPIPLSGTEKSEDARVNVYWNAQSEKVYLKVSQLPTPPPDKQYQLWAIIDGNPTDMGVLPKEFFLSEIIAMPNKVSNVAAFAITLEEEGGKPTPNLEELYVIGNV